MASKKPSSFSSSSATTNHSAPPTTFVQKVIANVKSQVSGLGSLAQLTFTSGTYIYPLKGTSYLLTHRELWKPFTARLLPLMGISAGIVAAMFALTYFPQAFILQFVNGPLAWLTTIPLVLGESATLIGLVVRQMGWVQEGLTDVFDAVLLQKGQKGLLSQGREVDAGATGDKVNRNPLKALGKVKPSSQIHKRLNPVNMISNYLMTLPLNFVPVIGTALFVAIQGRRLGPTFHERYFGLKGYDSRRRADAVDQDKGGYMGFGIMAFALQCIPVVGLLAQYANAVGAALWAADMESGKYRVGGSNIHLQGGPSQSVRGMAAKAGYDDKKEL